MKYSNGGVSATMLHGHQSSSGSARLRHHFTELHLNDAPRISYFIWHRNRKLLVIWLQGMSKLTSWFESENMWWPVGEVAKGESGWWWWTACGPTSVHRLVGSVLA